MPYTWQIRTFRFLSKTYKPIPIDLKISRMRILMAYTMVVRNMINQCADWAVIENGRVYSKTVRVHKLVHVI